MKEDDIVITGFSAYFPQADHLVEFKEKLYAGVDFVTGDDARWPRGHLGLPDRKGTIRDLSRFDAQFFGVNPKQAHMMDPQTRLLLETTYEAIVDAGYDPSAMRGRKVGVFIGCSESESEKAMYGRAERDNGYAVLGNNRAVFANRISYSFDFNGPSVAVETACSSTLVALNDAMMALRTGQCEAAVVGGSLLTLDPTRSLAYSGLGMLAPDGKCKSFDARRDGYARSETVGVFFIQRAREARRVYAKIVNVKSNADGYKTEGLSYPSAKLQAKLLREVYAEANIDPTQVDYVEAHATGTEVGDRVELSAISSVFCNSTRKRPLKIGAVKSNVGHSETASGICAIAKVILAMETGTIAGNLHYKEAGVDIPSLLDGSVAVVDRATPFTGGPVGINSFGFGGANAHAILEPNPRPEADSAERDKPELPRLVLMAGRSGESLLSTMDRMETEGPYPDSAYALLNFAGQPSVAQFPFRGFVLAPVDGSAKPTLKTVEEAAVEERPLWFIFTGFGCQWNGMARQMMHFDVFARSLEKSHQVLAQFSVDLIADVTTDGHESLSRLSIFTSITAIQVALVDVLFSIGLHPDGIIGHSLGEIAAAYADGTLTAEQAVMCAYWRGRCLDLTDLPKGSMAAIGLTWEEAAQRCCDGAQPACHNAEDSVTVSGPPEAVNKLLQQLKDENVFVREVEGVDVAYHTQHLGSAGPILLEALRKVIPEPRRRSKRWISSSIPESRWNDPIAQMSSAEYHVNNLLSPVLFCEAMKHVPANAIAIEIAPHCLLQAILRRSLGSAAASLGLMKRHTDNVEFFLSSLGKLHILGVKMDVSPLYPPVPIPVPRGTPSIGHLVSWDHSQSWTVAKWEDFGSSPKLSQEIVEFTIGDNGPDDYLSGHQIQGRILFPATGYIVLAWKSLAKRLGKPFHTVAVVLEDVRFNRATIMQKHRTTRFHVTIMEASGDFEISEAGTVVASGRIRMAAENERVIDTEPPCTGPDDGDVPYELDSEEVYRDLKLRGLEYQGQFQGILKASIQRLNGVLKWEKNWVTFLDSMLQGTELTLMGRLSKLPIKIIACRIDPILHLEMAEKAMKAGLGYVCNKHMSSCRSGGIILQGIETTVVPRRIATDSLVVSEHVFVPYIDNESARQRRQACIQEYVDLCSQVAQCALQNHDKAQHIANEGNSNIPNVLEGKEHCNQKDDAEYRGLLKVLFDIKEDMTISASSSVEIIQTALAVGYEELENDVLKTSLFEEDPLGHLIDVVVENASAAKLGVCELVTATCSRILTNDIAKLVLKGRANLKVRCTVALLSGSDITSPNFPEGTDIVHWNPSGAPSNELPEADLLVACLPTWGTSDLGTLVKELSAQCKKQEFVLIVLRTAVTPAEKLLMSAGGIQIQVHTDNAVERLFNSYGFTVVGVKSNNFAALILLRNTKGIIEAAKPELVKVSNDNFHWVDVLKTKASECDKKPRGHTIWLLGDDNGTSGVIGLANCLRFETGGRHVRCILVGSLNELKESVDISTNSQAFNNLLKQDLVMNVYRDGQWGSFRDACTPFNVPQKICTELAFLNVQTQGDLSSLQWYESPLSYASPKCQSARVLCSVYYAPLNFRDIMIATGRLASNALPQDRLNAECHLGLEFSGRDPEGRRVMAFVESHGISTAVLVHPDFLLEVPEAWSLEEASTVPVVYMSAYLALIVRGNMLPGESLLVHSGSGGVGQAAISIALAMGCTVFTTVGSQEKRDFLKRRFPQLKDRNISNSRDTSFEEDVLRETEGRGVDLVLNSLADAKLKASVRCLAEHGRFLEIGKFDLSKDTPLGMSVFLRDVTFHGIHLDVLYSSSPFAVEKRRRVMQLVRDGITSGVVQPLNAVRFPSEQAEDAFRYLASGKHIGKVVIEIRAEETQPVTAPPRAVSVQVTPRTRFYEDKSYIIVGGLGGVGLELADWMISRGCRKLVLSTRSGVRTGYQRYCLDRWKGAGANVLVSTSDASTLNGSLRVINEAAKIGPVGGIFNLGVVLRDAILENQTSEAFEAVCKIKIDGTKHLDQLSRKLCPQLDHFVVFSSLTSSRGNLGQTNYGYANSAMERICERRTAAGLPGLAIQWGPIDDVGAYHRTKPSDFEDVMPQPIASCIYLMDQFMSRNAPVVSSFVKRDQSTKEENKKRDVMESVARILGVKSLSNLKPDVTLGENGMDSLMAVEVKQTLERDFDIALSMQQTRQLTIKHLREIGEGTRKNDAAPPKADPLTSDQGTTDSPESPRHKDLESLVHEDMLLEMNGLEGSSPLFILHPIEGHARALKELAKHLPVRALGVQRTADVPAWCIREMAKTYLKAIKRAQHSGPYHLAGYSYGAAVAFEIALQLQSTGARVGSLVLLDGAPEFVTTVVGYRRDLLDEATDELETNILCSYLMQYIVADFSEVRGMLCHYKSSDTKLNAAVDIFMKNFAGPRPKREDVARNMSSSCECMKAASLYKPNRKFNGNVVLIKASRQRDIAQRLPPDYGLSECCNGEVDVRVVEGSHETFIVGEGAQQCASIISQHIQRWNTVGIPPQIVNDDAGDANGDAAKKT